jgi:hypothetical protein
MTKKVIVTLYGGPGTGKSTVAAALFAMFKRGDHNAELVREYIKNWVWEGREVKPGDQIYIASKQSKHERICFNDVDVIITDSPIWLSEFYEQKYDNTYPVCEHIVNKHVQLATLAGFEICHIFLHRAKKYNPAGRFQTEAEAKEIDTEILDFIKHKELSFVEYTADGNVEEAIYDYINQKIINK